MVEYPNFDKRERYGSSGDWTAPVAARFASISEDVAAEDREVSISGRRDGISTTFAAASISGRFYQIGSANRSERRTLFRGTLRAWTTCEPNSARWWTRSGTIARPPACVDER